ncbi:hypothetical protein NO559_06295 [Dasania sp. GY-MA-18]|uniref:DUF1585 domain-containing protein n=1 Tax=Dasania phycosphaerae TaxID=2950436 RepID=A0A9J6RK66_9GAMM|nr:MULTISPECIES: hypothetical protein [Dasania]MCR8922374.1 hypothetical protein [Dasania sp. GY-MA-18]MCZ0864802.1 hypothetical protein [Dasania phycosphaerae]MCZ0868530.1 hypothetical protein [Dasania phycosphaerae]
MKAWITMLMVAAILPSLSMAGPREQARRIHDRLTGTPPSENMLNRMTAAITAGNAVQAAEYAMDGAPDIGSGAEAANGNFYNVVVKNWITPATNQSFNAFAPLNDYSATVIGMVRDSGATDTYTPSIMVDFRELLSGDIIYTGNIPGIPAYNNSDNNHYEFLENSAANMGDDSVLQYQPQSSVTGIATAGIAGVQTTRAAARAFFIDGTNRAMFRYTLVNHLCMDLEQLKDTTRPSDRIRQDVSRSPGLDSTLFLNQCVGCHSGMDPMAQAYAYHQYDYPTEADMPGASQEQREELGQLLYTPGAVQPKYLINATTFAPGYVTPNDHWTNYWRLGDNSERIGWLNPAIDDGTNLALNPQYSEGIGASSLGRELAHSKAFTSCQVKKTYRSVCGREPGPADSADVNSIAANFNASGNMKRVFAEVAVACANHL